MSYQYKNYNGLLCFAGVTIHYSIAQIFMSKERTWSSLTWFHYLLTDKRFDDSARKVCLHNSMLKDIRPEYLPCSAKVTLSIAANRNYASKLAIFHMTYTTSFWGLDYTDLMSRSNPKILSLLSWCNVLMVKSLKFILRTKGRFAIIKYVSSSNKHVHTHNIICLS